MFYYLLIFNWNFTKYIFCIICSSFLDPTYNSGNYDLCAIVVTPFLRGPSTFYLFKELLKWHKQELEWRWQSSGVGQLKWRAVGLFDCWSGQLAVPKFYLAQSGSGTYWRGPAGAAFGAHCCWPYLIIAFHFVSGECRKLNANLHDTNRSGQCGWWVAAVVGGQKRNTATITPTIIIIIITKQPVREQHCPILGSLLFFYHCVRPDQRNAGRWVVKVFRYHFSLFELFIIRTAA